MSFKEAVKFVIIEEGGHVLDPDDPGGETKFGISKKSYPELNIATLTKEAAIKIYKRDYWEKLPVLPDSLKFLVFDCAVNVGTSRAIKLLQTAIGASPDGHFGPRSQAALKRKQEVEVLCLFQAERARHYALLDHLDDYFARGWMRRTMRAFYYAIKGNLP